jgi:hypothetical protein
MQFDKSSLCMPLCCSVLSVTETVSMLLQDMIRDSIIQSTAAGVLLLASRMRKTDWCLTERPTMQGFSIQVLLYKVKTRSDAPSCCASHVPTAAVTSARLPIARIDQRSIPCLSQNGCYDHPCLELEIACSRTGPDISRRATRLSIYPEFHLLCAKSVAR